MLNMLGLFLQRDLLALSKTTASQRVLENKLM